MHMVLRRWNGEQEGREQEGQMEGENGISEEEWGENERENANRGRKLV